MFTNELLISKMATEGKPAEDTLSDLECLRAIMVRNLPSDVDNDLLQCLFPEASEIKLNEETHGKDNQRSSIIIFPKVSNALYYADQDRSIQLDQNLLSIQSLVHSEESAATKDQASPSHSGEEQPPSAHSPEKEKREQAPDKDRDRDRDRPSQTRRGGNRHKSSNSSGRRSLSPPHRKKHGDERGGRSSSNRDPHSHGDDRDSKSSAHPDAQTRTRPRRYKDFFHQSVKERMILVKNLPPTVTKYNLFTLFPNAWDISIAVDPANATDAIGVVEFYTEKEATVFIKEKHHLRLDQHVLSIKPYEFDSADLEPDTNLRTRSQSPPLATQRFKSPLLSHPTRRRSRSPLSRPMRRRSRSPLLSHPVRRRSRSPLLSHPMRRRSRSPLLSHPMRHRSRSPLLNYPTRHRSRSPLLDYPMRHRSRSPLLSRPSRHRSRSPLLSHPSRRRSPLLSHPSRHRSQSPLLGHPSRRRSPLRNKLSRRRSPLIPGQPPRGRSPLLPLPPGRSPLLPNPVPRSRSPEVDVQRNPSFLSTSSSADKLKIRGRPPENDKYHFTAKQLEEKVGGGGGGDRRFVSITSKGNEKFNPKKWNKYFRSAACMAKTKKVTEDKSNKKAKGIFNQFKDQAKKFANENPDSARALNELLLALGHTNKMDLGPSGTSSLDDLQKAFNPGGSRHLDARYKDSRKSDNKNISDPLNIPKLSSVLDQVKDLSQNLGILSQLSKLAKHLNANRTDSSAIMKATLTLKNLVSKTTLPESSLPDDSRTTTLYNNQTRKRDTQVAPLPEDNYYNSAETAALPADEKYVAIDYNHQKAADKIVPQDRSTHSPYTNENYLQTQYDDTHGFKDRHRQDYEVASQSSHRSGQDFEAATRSGRGTERDYETASLPGRRTRQDYDTASRSGRGTGPEYEAASRSDSRTGQDYEAAARSSRRTGQDYEAASRSDRRTGPAYEAEGQSGPRSGQNFDTASRSGSRTGQDYDGASRAGSRTGQDYDGASRSGSRTGQDYDGANRSGSRTGQDYDGASRSGSRTGQDYEAASRSGHRTGQDYDGDNRPGQRTGQDYDGANQSSHRSEQDYDGANQPGQRTGQDYDGTNRSGHRSEQDYDGTNRSGHRTGQDYDRANRSSHRSEQDYDGASRSSHRSEQDYERANRSGQRTGQDYDVDNRSGPRPGYNHQQYDQMSQPFEEVSSHDGNNWQNVVPRNQTGPCDPRELGLMDHDDRVWSSAGPNEFPHDTDSRVDRMPHTSRDDGFCPDGNNCNDLDDRQRYPEGLLPHPRPGDLEEGDEDDEEETDPDGKPMGWRYYSLGVKAFRWK